MQTRVPGIEPTVFVDDAGATAERPGLLQKALDITKEFADLTGQQLHDGKCKGFTTVTRHMKRLKLGTAKLEQTTAVRCLGVWLASHSDIEIDSQSRLLDAQDAAARLLGVPLPFHVRTQLLEALVLPRALHGCEAMRLDRRRLQGLNTSVVKVLLGGRRGRNCSIS